MLATQLTEREKREFLWESWRFVKQIFPLLIVGMIREAINPAWIETLAGSNTVFGNFIGVVFGALYLVNRYTSTSPISRQG